MEFQPWPCSVHHQNSPIVFPSILSPTPSLSLPPSLPRALSLRGGRFVNGVRLNSPALIESLWAKYSTTKLGSNEDRHNKERPSSDTDTSLGRNGRMWRAALCLLKRGLVGGWRGGCNAAEPFLQSLRWKKLSEISSAFKAWLAPS